MQLYCIDIVNSQRWHSTTSLLRFWLLQPRKVLSCILFVLFVVNKSWISRFAIHRAYLPSSLGVIIWLAMYHFIDSTYNLFNLLYWTCITRLLHVQFIWRQMHVGTREEYIQTSFCGFSLDVDFRSVWIDLLLLSYPLLYLYWNIIEIHGSLLLGS